jgi:hypothetical protein
MVNALSFCLYGPENPRYYPGMLQNVDLAAKYFPDWKVYVYVAPDVDPGMVETLRSRSNVVVRDTGVTGPVNMIHRFYAIDEPEVDLMMVRDADSRIHWKDRWAIREFLRHPQFVAHTIRDNREHKAEMMGGLWGLRKSSGINVHKNYAAYAEDTSRGRRNGHDQNFLTDVIYPQVVGRLLVHYSCGRFFRNEYAIEFPFDWNNDIYCGRVEFEHVDAPEPRPSSRVFKMPTGQVPLPISQSLSVSAPPPTSSPPSISIRDTYVPPIVKFLHRK